MSKQTVKKKVGTDLINGKPFQTLIAFSIPFLLSSLLQSLYGTVDTLVVGNFSSTASVSAVATGAQVLGMMTFLAFGLSNGATVLLGQSVGARDDKKSAKIVGNTIIDFTAISVLLTVLLLLLFKLVLKLLNIPEEAQTEAEKYCFICALGIPLIVGYNTVGALLRAIGDSKSPLIFVAIAAVFNILGDTVLTGFLKMGATGVAISTVASQGISFLISLLFLMKRGLGFQISKEDIRFDKLVTKQIFKIGIPMGLQSILVNLSFMFITSIINSLGVAASASMGIGDKIVNFAFLPHQSVSAALAVIVAQNIGARKTEACCSVYKTWHSSYCSHCICLYDLLFNFSKCLTKDFQ